MKPETMFTPDNHAPIMAAQPDLHDMAIECVTLDAAGRPRRRRLTPLLSLLKPVLQGRAGE